MAKILFKNAQIINRGRITAGDLLIENGKIAKVGGIIEATGALEISAEGKYLMPGIIDDQVHFRVPGLTH